MYCFFLSGEKELIKLEAYTFTEYPVVVHVDLDVLVLKSLDNLFDAMLGVGDNPISKVELMWPDQPVPAKINAFFTRDCKFYSKVVVPCVNLETNVSCHYTFP